MARSSRYRRRKRTWLGDVLANPKHQMMMTVIGAVVFSGFVFTGLLLFRYSAEEDLLSEGKRLMTEQKVATAKDTLEQLVNRYPKSYEGHLLLGKAYLALEESGAAEKEFKLAASLKSRKARSGLAEIAMAQLAVVHKDYTSAEKILLTELKKAGDKEPTKDLKEALFSLYNGWGDSFNKPLEAGLDNKEKDEESQKTAKDNKKTDAPVDKEEEKSKKTEKRIRIYERALKYADSFEQERRVTDKLTDIIDLRVEELNKQNKYKETIALLKKSVELRKQPETMLKLAYAYDKTDELDEAIKWYRKAYRARPDVISMQLSNALMKKAQKLKSEGKKKEADALISEAEAVVRKAKLPLDELYPVAVSDVSISSELDSVTGEMMPKVRVSLENEGQRSLNFLKVKAEFITGDELLTDVEKVVASEKDPMGASGEPNQKSSITLVPPTKLNIHLLKNNQLMVKILLAYDENENQEWKVKAIQEAVIKDEAALSNDENLQPLNAPPVPLPDIPLSGGTR